MFHHNEFKYLTHSFKYLTHSFKYLTHSLNTIVCNRKMNSLEYFSQQIHIVGFTRLSAWKAHGRKKLVQKYLILVWTNQHQMKNAFIMHIINGFVLYYSSKDWHFTFQDIFGRMLKQKKSKKSLWICIRQL